MFSKRAQALSCILCSLTERKDSEAMVILVQGGLQAKPVSLFQRAEREALKPEAQHQKEKAARVTRTNLNYRIHLPIISDFEPELITPDLEEDLEGAGNVLCDDDSVNVTRRKRRRNCNQSHNRSAENASKRYLRETEMY